MFELLGCDITVEPQHMSAIVRTESSANPFAIGIVGHHLNRQATTLNQASQLAQYLSSHGYNYSIGISQVNQINFPKQNLNNKSGFNVCKNLLAGSNILKSCYKRYGTWKKAYSCYYSGNPVTGFSHGYVEKVVTNYKKPILEKASYSPKDINEFRIIPRYKKSLKLTRKQSQYLPDLAKGQ